MKNHMPLVLFFFTSFLLLSDSSTIDTISADIGLKDDDTIASNGEVFELGFFSPNNTRNRYLGIWYKKISYGTVVWVANRETPITGTRAMLKVSSNGRLLIVNGNNTKIWSSNSMLSAVKNPNPVAQLLDNGNLVVWDKIGTDRNMIWQSFDYPCNTLLPGMKFGKDFVTGIDRYFTSWKSHDDPSPGPYVYSVDTNGYPQIFQRKGSVLRSRVGPWNGVKFQGLPNDQPNELYSCDFIVNQKEIYVKFELKSLDFARAVTRSDGNTVHLQWVDRIQDWIFYGNPGVDTCGSYGVCGPYGSCSINKYPPCSCIVGFEPKVQEEWNSGDWSSRCQHKESFTCGSKNGFKKLVGLKFPDTRRSWYNLSMTLRDCEMKCRRNCSCTAYANLDIINGGSGCLLWFGELMDIREYDEHQDIYIRMAASALAGVTKASKRKGVLTTVLVISSAALLSFVAFAYRNRKLRRHMKVGENIPTTREVLVYRWKMLMSYRFSV